MVKRALAIFIHHGIPLTKPARVAPAFGIVINTWLSLFIYSLLALVHNVLYIIEDVTSACRILV